MSNPKTISPPQSLAAAAITPTLKTQFRFDGQWHYLPTPPNKGHLPQWQAVTRSYMFRRVVLALDAHPLTQEGFSASYAHGVLDLLEAHLYPNKDYL